ncbi:glycosyltransferase [Candidatus Parvarchaeota archaeon]|nr:glycosyltransferase [Candidatus Acidifodinimicrobium mancum]
MKKLRIAFYTDDYPPITAGTTSYVMEMRKELERRGHEVFIITAGDSKTAEFAKNDPHVIVLRGPKFIDGKHTVAVDVVTLLRALNGKKFDIVHSHSPFLMGFLAVISSKVTGSKLVSTFHTYLFHKKALSKYISYTVPFLSSNRVLLKISKFFMVGYLRVYYFLSDKVVAPSRFVRRLLRRNGISNTEVVENGVKVAKGMEISKREARKHLNLSLKSRFLLYLGRVDDEKNLDFLLNSAKKLGEKGFKIIIAGSGHKRKQYIKMSEDMKLTNVYFPGFIRDKDKKYYYRAADVFCNPSTFDTAGLADIEAMSFNLPILVPKTGAQSEFVQAGPSGEVFEISDVSDFVDKAVKIAENRRKYNPRAVAKAYSISKSADKLILLYKHLLTHTNNSKVWGTK